MSHAEDRRHPMPTSGLPPCDGLPAQGERACSRRRDILLGLSASVLAAGVFLLDLTTPPGIATGILYVFVVILAWYCTAKWPVIVAAVVCAWLVLASLVLWSGTEAPGALSRIAYLNRWLALAVIVGALGALWYLRLMTERVEMRTRQQRALADLSQYALEETDDLQSLMDRTVRSVADTLGVDYCKILELQKDGESLLLRAGVGWREGLVGHATVGTGNRSQGGYALMSQAPVIVGDLRHEIRISGPWLLHEHGVVSGMSCIITGPDTRSYGVLGAHTRTRRRFCPEDTDFLQGAANVVAQAIHRQRAMRQARAADARYLSLVNNLPDAVYSMLPDALGTVTFVSSRWCDWTGCAPDEVIRDPNAWSRAIHPEDRARVLAAYRQAREERRVYQYEYRLVHGATGRVRHVLDHARPVYDEDGLVRLFDGTVTDITDQKHHQEALCEFNKVLERRVLERTRTLVEQQARLRSLAAELTLTEHRERRRLATDLHDYLAQLLVVCRLKLPRLTRTEDPSDLGQCVQEIDRALDEALSYTRSLVVELSPPVLYQFGLPAALEWLAEHMHRYGLRVTSTSTIASVPLSDDRAVLLFQSVREILFNVLKHARTDRATLHLERQAGMLAITVRDQGLGFDPDRLMRSEASSERFGLFSIRERLQSIHGTLEVSSSPGQGTTATLRVPFQETGEAAAAPAPTLSQDALAPPADQQGRIRVLLADDHPVVRQGVRTILQGFADLVVVGEAGDGEEVLALARGHAPDVVVMDVNMPGVNGIEATRRLAREQPHVKVVGLSVNNDHATEHAMRAAGAVSYIDKASVSAELYHAIRKAHSSVRA